MPSNPSAPSRRIRERSNGIKGKFARFSTWVTKATGSSTAFFLALLVVPVWAVTGPVFNFSEKWQLVINTGTMIITFLMIFVIQQSQNKDTLAVHLKLNELIAANEFTGNPPEVTEDLTEEELQVNKKYYKRISGKSKRENTVYISHSLDEAEMDAAGKQPRPAKSTAISKP